MTKSEQARADAMADAETLRLYLGDPAHGAEGRLGIVTRYTCVVESETYGMASPHMAARAAFRAVPALKSNPHADHGEWDGTPSPNAPADVWVCDTCGEYVPALRGED